MLIAVSASDAPPAAHAWVPVRSVVTLHLLIPAPSDTTLKWFHDAVIDPVGVGAEYTLAPGELPGVVFPPGAFTAHVTSASGASGDVLLECYDVPLDFLVGAGFPAE